MWEADTEMKFLFGFHSSYIEMHLALLINWTNQMFLIPIFIKCLELFIPNKQSVNNITASLGAINRYRYLQNCYDMDSTLVINLLIEEEMREEMIVKSLLSDVCSIVSRMVYITHLINYRQHMESLYTQINSVCQHGD